MGNKLANDYEYDEKPIGSGGPEFMWRIHNGVHRQSRKEVSIFVCIENSHFFTCERFVQSKI